MLAQIKFLCKRGKSHDYDFIWRFCVIDWDSKWTPIYYTKSRDSNSHFNESNSLD